MVDGDGTGTPQDYDYRSYWDGLHARGGLSAVGHQALSDQINAWIYRTRRRNLRRFARAHGLSGGRMLEVGVGTGYWLSLWRELGYRVDGCDLVPEAVDRLQELDPHGSFWQADVSSPDGISGPAGVGPEGGYDLVAAVDVLLHVTDDDRFRQALVNLAALVRPGGHLLLAEPVITRSDRQPPYHPKYSSRARVLKTYRRPLRQAGMRFVTVEPTTVLACNPIEAATPRRLRAYQRWWAVVRGASEHPVRRTVVGPLMYAADPLLLRAGEAPTSKLVLFRRRREPQAG